MFSVIVLRMLPAVLLLNCLSCKIDFDFQIHQFSQVVVAVGATAAPAAPAPAAAAAAVVVVVYYSAKASNGHAHTTKATTTALNTTLYQSIQLNKPT